MPALQNVTVLNPFLRKLDYDSYSKLVLRQAPPLPAVPQPPNGHSLAFYILEGMCLKHFHLYYYPVSSAARQSDMPTSGQQASQSMPEGIRVYCTISAHGRSTCLNWNSPVLCDSRVGLSPAGAAFEPTCMRYDYLHIRAVQHQSHRLKARQTH